MADDNGKESNASDNMQNLKPGIDNVSDGGDPEKLVDDPTTEAPRTQIDRDIEENEGMYEDEGLSDIGEGVDGEESIKDDVVEQAVGGEQYASSKKKFQLSLKKLCGCMTNVAKVYTFHDDNDSTASLFDERPPLPRNMPRAEDFRRRIAYREQRVHYGRDKVEHYIQQSKEGTLNPDDVVMKSELGASHIQRL